MASRASFRWRRRGIGSHLCQHSLQAEVAEIPGDAFNLVVSTNTAGISCWQRNGFQILGTLLGASRHLQLGHVDARMMIQILIQGNQP